MRTSARRSSRVVSGVLTLPVLVGVLAGCQLPNLGMSAPITEESAETSEAPATTTPRATTAEAAATSIRPSGELDAGSVTHVQAAGDRDLVIDYWTTQQATEWTPADTKSIQLSAHLEGAESTATTIEVLVTRFSAVLDDGTTRTTVVDDQGEFAIQPPFTYGTAIELSASDPDVDTVTVTVQFDLLVETGRNTDRYYRQTVIDTLELPLVIEEDTP